MKNSIESAIGDAQRAIEFLKREHSLLFIERAAELLAESFQKGGKILVAGNGGSLCDAMHFVEELTGVFRAKRPALAAIALSDPGHMSCVANDIGYEYVFSRAIEALGSRQDVFIALTTSGNSANLVQAVKTAKEKGMMTIAFLGKSGGLIKGECDLELCVEGFTYSDRIQEAHMTAIHIIIEMVEKLMFSSCHSAQECSVADVY